MPDPQAADEARWQGEEPPAPPAPEAPPREQLLPQAGGDEEPPTLAVQPGGGLGPEQRSPGQGNAAVAEADVPDARAQPPSPLINGGSGQEPHAAAPVADAQPQSPAAHAAGASPVAQAPAAAAPPPEQPPPPPPGEDAVPTAAAAPAPARGAAPAAPATAAPSSQGAAPSNLVASVRSFVLQPPQGKGHPGGGLAASASTGHPGGRRPNGVHTQVRAPPPCTSALAAVMGLCSRARCAH